jgi:hypothetical protein
MAGWAVLLAAFVLGDSHAGQVTARPAGVAKSLVALVSVSVSPNPATEGGSVTAAARANIASCPLSIDWGDGTARTPVASGQATHAYGKPGTYTVKAIAGGSCGGGATAGLTVRSRLQADLANATAFAGDDCQRRDCHPVIVDVSPTTFGPGIHVTLTGTDFGNLRGSVQFAAGGAPRPLDIVSWTGSRIVASGDKLSGLNDGPASLTVKATNGRQSIAAAVRFIAARWLPNLQMMHVAVKTCAQGTSDNQCNDVHVGEHRKGVGIAIDLGARRAIRAHHADYCDGPFCLGWPEGVDEYYVKGGSFTIQGVSKRISCALFSGNGNRTCTADVEQFPAASPYKQLIRVHWKNSPKTDGLYELTIRIDAPRGMY